MKGKFINNTWFKLFIKLFITAGIIFLVLQFIIGIHIYYGNNMYPKIEDGSLCIINKLDKNYYSELVVAYKHNNQTKLGRIIGQPGDKIIINDNGHVLVNGNILMEKIFYNTLPSDIEYPYIVPENQYFILNDYREDLTDSRTFGAIPEEDIIGQIYLIIQRRGF